MRVAIRWVLVRDPSGEKEPQAFLCTDLEADPVDILRWFVRRWRTETTFEEARRHLGMETQRQWSDLAILRTTPALLGLFSLVTLWASQLAAERGPAARVRPLVSQAAAHLQRRSRPRPARTVDRADFRRLTGRPRPPEKSRPMCIDRLLLVACRPP